MMYGYGDDEEPLPETVACMQELVSEYIRHVTDEACKAAAIKGGLDTGCFMFAIRGDRAKYKRARELMDLNVHIKSTTRLRFTDHEMPVFQPSFQSPPRIRAVASLPCLGPEGPEPKLPPSRSSPKYLEPSSPSSSSDSEEEGTGP